ncbi:MAG: DHH family phosphoesterase [Promethearchaeota archaeon]
MEEKKILITTHELVDIDALASCFSLKFFLSQYFRKDNVIIWFSELTKLSKTYLNKFSQKFPLFNITFNKKVDIENIDVVIILDTNNLNLVSLPNDFDISRSKIPFIFIDHHLSINQNYENNVQFLNVIIDDYSSTAEIIFKFFTNFNIDLCIPIKWLLISAIITDSGNFKYGSSETIVNVSKLLDDNFDIQEIFLMLNYDRDISEKLAIIKGIQRVEIIRENNWLIGLTHIGSFEANVANALIKIGFDVGIVYMEKKETYRISIRAKKNVCLKTGLHLGKILDELSDGNLISGGGHDGAAAIKGKIDLKKVLAKILEKVKQILNK